MLAVIDYGAGNLRSVLHALKYLGAKDVNLVHTPNDLKGAKKVILPGVGAFGAGMQALHQQDLVKPLQDIIAADIPYLGICLGMQFLFEESNEMGQHHGLGILKGHVTRFARNPNYKVPHMGWNQLHFTRKISLFDNIAEGSYAYFVHSYYCVPKHAEDTVISVNYDNSFTAAVHRNNIFGVQFHPEKSQKVGLQILRNFLSLEY